jgi:hypothetical protein
MINLDLVTLATVCIICLDTEQLYSCVFLIFAQRINPCPIYQTSVKVLPLFALSKHTWKFLI